MATFNLAPGYKNFDIYCQRAIIDTSHDDYHPQLMKGIIADEEEEEYVPTRETQHQPRGWTKYFPTWDKRNQKVPATSTTIPPQTEKPTPRAFDLNGPEMGTCIKVPTTSNTEAGTMSPTAREFLKLHYKMGHMSFAKMQIMAKQGTIPAAFANCEIPVCTACMFAKQTRRPWRSKQARNYHITKPTKPGEVVSVDQMVSPTPGLIAQMTGILTKKRYKYATVYVDQATRLGYVYLQQSATAEETIKGKIIRVIDGDTVVARTVDNKKIKDKINSDTGCTSQVHRSSIRGTAHSHPRNIPGAPQVQPRYTSGTSQ